MNMVENALNIIYLSLSHSSSTPSPLAPLVGLIAASLTLAKTVLYWVMEYYSGFANIGHNSVERLVFLWIIPNGIWIVVPAIVVHVLYAELKGVLNGAAGVEKVEGKGKGGKAL